MIIELLDGTQIDVHEFYLRRLSTSIPSANVEHQSVSLVDRHDAIISTKLNTRIISVEFLFIAEDIHDYDLVRDKVNALFMRQEPFYIIFKRQKWKKWRVKVANQYVLPTHPRMSSFTVEFIALDGYAKSVGSSLDLVERSFDSGLWGFGSGIDVSKNYQYQFTTSDFVVDNIGNVEIDPRTHNLEIIIKATSNNLRIRNLTTGDTYEFTAPLIASDELRIKGVQTLKNGVSAFKHTNKQLLTLAVGENQIVIDGGTLISASFNFDFLYL